MDFNNGSKWIVSRSPGRGALCGACVMVLFTAGCAGGNPCIENPCDDGLICNGVEVCSAAPFPQNFTCTPGAPLACADACEEPVGCTACSTDADCDDGDPCTSDECRGQRCVPTPIECPAGEVCVPQTGMCVGLDGG